MDSRLRGHWVAVVGGVTTVVDMPNAFPLYSPGAA